MGHINKKFLGSLRRHIIDHVDKNLDYLILYTFQVIVVEVRVFD
jgi:hypothetical protein